MSVALEKAIAAEHLGWLGVEMRALISRQRKLERVAEVARIREHHCGCLHPDDELKYPFAQMAGEYQLVGCAHSDAVGEALAELDREDE